MYDDAGRLMVLFQINRYIQQLRYSFFPNGGSTGGGGGQVLGGEGVRAFIHYITIE